MDYNWMPMVGLFEEKGKGIVFKGQEIKTDDGSRPEIGNLLFNKNFNGGTISTEIEFEEVSANSTCEIIVYYNNSGSKFQIVTAGISSGPIMFSIRDFDGKQWNYRAASGDGRNLKAGKKYKIIVTFKGSKLYLKVDGIDVLSTVLPFSLQQSQVGIWCQDYKDILIHSFKVETEIPKVFVVMEFDSPYNELHNDVIKKVCNEMNLEAIRGDESYTCGMIIADIINQITESKLIIADITPNNPNVYYEVGYAHALNKPTILIAENPTKLPFDVSPFRVLFYENSIRGKDKIEDGLRKHLQEIIYK